MAIEQLSSTLIMMTSRVLFFAQMHLITGPGVSLAAECRGSAGRLGEMRGEMCASSRERRMVSACLLTAAVALLFKSLESAVSDTQIKDVDALRNQLHARHVRITRPAARPSRRAKLQPAPMPCALLSKEVYRVYPVDRPRSSY